MGHRNRDYLFAQLDLTDQLRAKEAKIQEKVDSINKDQFLATPYNDLIDFVVNQNTSNPIIIYEERISASEPSECEIDVSGDSGRFVGGTGQPYYIAGHEITIEVPYSGDEYLLMANPNIWGGGNPTGLIRPGGDGVGTIVMVFRQPHDSDPNQIKSSYERNLN